ncbi:chemotaxis protein MotB [Duganella sp. CF402]|jgi:chemotaxis protein MotB|uniref:flagellar motor protein MotD n=1 Tax=unclassified Duganella TaxID=2636909 RepID=UPI0008AB5931|nr:MULTISPECIES: flagellar motor protein MotD [unclassified Duganella]RZT08997.1 chemotaxis protein MotB [Duganella sp. BK701]SEL74297.1 chemotaxis protein MotB [Duganella sp. CF402]
MQYRRARRRFDDEPENHERWLISYADFITLLFAFFVVMYAISAVNIGKYKIFSDALGDAFGGKGAAQPVNTEVPNLPVPNPALKRRVELLRKEKEQMTKLAQDLLSTMAPLVKEGKVRVTQNSRGVSVEINASVLFDPGDARLMPESVEALRAVASLLKADSHDVQVEGHTDNQPIGNTRFPSNWELSSVRASSVVRLFIDAGVAPQRLTAVGYSSNVPVADNDSAQGRARNRRVAVTILSGIPDPSTEVATN